MRTTYQSSSSRNVSMNQRNVENLPQSDVEAERAFFLKYSSINENGSSIVSGSSDLGVLSGLREGILKLKADYFTGSGSILIKGEERTDFEKRFLLFEHEIDGLLRRRVEYTGTDYLGGTRNMDFTSLINEKENYIIQLEKRIENFEERLRRAYARQLQLENKIVELNAQLLAAKDRSLTGQRLDMALNLQTENERIKREMEGLRTNFSSAASIWKSQARTILQKYPNERLSLDAEIDGLLQSSSVKTYNINGFETIEVHSTRTVEVPVVDIRSRELIQIFATQLKSLTTKYPKLLAEFDSRISEYFSGELIEILGVDSLERIVEIVKYVPQTVRVENVYAYSSSKTRKVELHLRVLIKALLEELQKLRIRTGAVLEIDEEIIAMIRAEIMEIVSVDDILKVFKVAPKIVEVEKLIERVVEKIVEVPQVVPIERVIEKVVEVPRVQEIEKIVHVPVEVVKYVETVVEKIVEVPSVAEKIVEVPHIIQKVVEKVIEVPKIVEVDRIVEKVVTNTEVVTVDKVVDRIVSEPHEVIVYRDKIVPVETVVEKITEMPVIVEKVIDRVVEVEIIKPVEIVKEVIVEVAKPQPFEKETIVFNDVPQIIEKVVEKVVVVENVVERIVEVPQIIEKIVQIVQEVPKIVEVVKVEEKLVPVVEVREVERVNNVVVPLVKQVQKIVDRRIEVPVIQQRILTVPEIINQVVIEKVEIPRIVEVVRYVDRFFTEVKLIEVEKPIVHYIKDIQVVKAAVEKVVQVPRTVERIKEVRTKVEKIVEKLVEVPKVVEVEKIVEKVVVVPRVIEKIVEVPKIVEVVVQKLVQVEHVREVTCDNTICVEVEKPVEIQVLKNVYIEVEKPIEKIVEKVVPVESIVERVEVVEKVVEKVVANTNQVPKEIIVEKIVPTLVETQVFVEVEKPVTLIVEVPVEVEKIIEKPIAIPQLMEKIVQVPQVVEKIVEIVVEKKDIVTVDQVVEKMVEVPKVNVVNKKEYIYQDKIVQVPRVEQVSVPVRQVIKEQVPVEVILQKIVNTVVQIPKVVEIEKVIEKMVDKQKIIELETIVPQLVKVHEVIKQYVDKVVPITVREEVIKQVPVEVEKIVEIMVKDTEVREIETLKEKIVEVDRVKEITNTKNVFETQVQVVDRIEKTQVPVYTTVEKIVEVPQIMEKIVERVVLMPQIVEVLKYVHEIYEEETVGVALTQDVGLAEVRYRELYGNSKKQLQILLVELRSLKTAHPNLRATIEIIEKFLLEFDTLAAAQRIVTIDHEKVVEKQVEKGVLVPTVDVKGELAMALLVEKLVLQIKEIRKANPNIKLTLQDDIGFLFFSEIYDSKSPNMSNDFQVNITRYTETAISKFTQSGGIWSSDHEMMLHTVLTERFAMANVIKQANEEIEKAKALAEIKGKALREKETQMQKISQELYTMVSSDGRSQVSGQFWPAGGFIDSMIIKSSSFSKMGEPMRILGDFEGSGNDWSRLQSYVRERNEEIELLKGRLISIEKSSIHKQYSGVDNERTVSTLRAENSRLSLEVERLQGELSHIGGARTGSSGKERQLQLKLKTANSRIQELQSLLRTSELQLKQFKDAASSAATSRVDQDGTNMVHSQYSSSSNRQVTSPSYGTTGTTQPSYGNTGTTSNYRTSGTYGNMGASNTSGSGLAGSSGSLSGSQTGYTSNVTRNYGTSGTTLTGTVTVPGTNIGLTGTVTGTGTGLTGTVTGTGLTGSGLGSSGLGSSSYQTSYARTSTSGTTGATGTGATGSGTGSSSNYTFQTRKYDK